MLGVSGFPGVLLLEGSGVEGVVDLVVVVLDGRVVVVVVLGVVVGGGRVRYFGVVRSCATNEKNYNKYNGVDILLE